MDVPEDGDFELSNDEHFGSVQYEFAMNGDPFDLISVDVEYLYGGTTLTNSNGTSVQFLPYDVTCPTCPEKSDYGTYLFSGPEWQNITSFVWEFQSGGGSLDNFVFTSPVPEPASMFLLGTGLIGLAGFRRKKKK